MKDNKFNKPFVNSRNTKALVGLAETAERNKDKVNLYNCKVCGNTIVTLDVDKGTTPAMLSCKEHGGCEEGMMMSMVYNVPPILIPSHEWYKPTSNEGLSDMEIEHVEKGGLLIRKINFDEEG